MERPAADLCRTGGANEVTRQDSFQGARMTTTATPNAVTAPLAVIFAVNGELMSGALKGLTPEELWRTPTDRNNPMLWIAGHVVQTRADVLKSLGEAAETGWGGLFKRGAPLEAADRYPRRENIEQTM